VFQLTRAPGKKLVYLGSLLLVLGIFAMFYVRERRLWFWLKDKDEGGATVLMAMSTARRTLDFEKEFAQTRDTVAATLGGRPVAVAGETVEAVGGPASQPAAAPSESVGSHESTR
jgi:cytochrome c biogenesis protein